VKTDKPTPIPRRASRPKPEPTPLVIPQPNRSLTVVPKPLEGAELRNFIANCIARTLYKIASGDLMPEAEIVTMGEAQFEAFCRSVLEDAE
jgi:hypothetical protein